MEPESFRARPRKPAMLHDDEIDHDADFIVTAVAGNGTTIGKVTEDDVGSGEDIRTARRHGSRLLVVTGDDILDIDPAAGTV